ncbi:MAG: WD40 repeat domain-containing protein [Pirellulales bacterium]
MRFSPNSWITAIAVISAAITVAAGTSGFGQSKLPVQRLRTSDFRLTSKGGNGPTFCFSPDGKLVAGANWEEVRLWSFPDGKLLHDFSGAIQGSCIGFAVDGKALLVLEQRRMEVYRFDVASGHLLRTVHLEDVVDERGATTFRLSADGRWLFMTEVYNHFAVWDTTTGKRTFRKEIGIGKGGEGRISNAGVATLWDNLFIDRYDVRTGDQLGRTKIYQRMDVLAGNPQGTLLAAYSPADKSIIFWDTTNDKQTGGTIPLPEEFRGGLNEAAISSDGRRFVFWKNRDQWLWNRQVAIYDVESGTMISSVDPPGTYSLDQPEISPDGRYMFLAGGRSVFTPIDTATGKLHREIPDHILAVERLSFTPDGRTLLVGSRDKRQAWNVGTGAPGTVFEKWYHTPTVSAVSDDRALISGIKGGGIRLQAIDSGAIEREIETATDKYFAEIQLSVDRKTFIGVENFRGGYNRRWNVADGAVVNEQQLPVVDSERRFDPSTAIRGLTLGGTRLIRLEQVVPPSKRPDGSIDRGHVELVLDDWTAQLTTNRLPLPAMGRFAFDDNGILLAAVVSDDQTPRPYGEKWGSTHLILWDVATGWERLRVDREMHSYFGAFSAVAITRDGRLAATVCEHDRVEIWNGFNGYKLDSFDAGCDVTAITFSDDGTMLATGHPDGSVYLWSTRAAWDLVVQPIPLNKQTAKRCWDELLAAGRTPVLAWHHLLRNPAQATALLKDNLSQGEANKGVAAFLENALASLPVDEHDLADGSSPVSPMMLALKQAREKAPTDEARTYYEQLLDAASRPMLPKARRPILGILLAEQLNTEESRKLIEEFAAGPAGAFETQVAKSALVRIRSRAETTSSD